ncbi:MAG: MATE family efflux transporter [Clostridiales bacterium]|nr:MATE family efflux transporter [Clostridiales bacterium]
MNRAEKKQFNRELVTLAVPLALQQLLTALVGATDALVLGRLTQESIAAVSLANQISFVLSLFVTTVTGAAGILIAQYWGKGDDGKARYCLCTAIRYVTLISALFFLAAFLWPEQLMRIFTTEEELITIGAGYLRIVSFSYLFNSISQCYLTAMKISGYASMSVWISAVTVVVDVTADIFLVYGFGSFQGLGANGSAYSTIAVEAIVLIWCLVWSVKTKRLAVQASDFAKVSKLLEAGLWKIIPSMLASALSWGLSISMHSFLMGHMGTDATAAYSVVGVAQQLVQCLSHGFANGSGIMLGGLLGQNRLEEAKEYGGRFWMVSLFTGLVNVGLIGVVGPLVYNFYVLEPQAKAYLVGMLAMSTFYMFAYAYNTIFTCGVFPAGGDAKYDAVSVLLATWCFALPLALVGCFVLHLPVMAVYVLMCLDEIVKVPFLRWRYNKYIWLKNLTRE